MQVGVSDARDKQGYKIKVDPDDTKTNLVSEILLNLFISSQVQYEHLAISDSLSGVWKILETWDHKTLTINIHFVSYITHVSSICFYVKLYYYMY